MQADGVQDLGVCGKAPPRNLATTSLISSLLFDFSPHFPQGENIGKGLGYDWPPQRLWCILEIGCCPPNGGCTQKPSDCDPVNRSWESFFFAYINKGLAGKDIILNCPRISLGKESDR